jgi:superfamily II DNA/RNA helicase
VRDAARDASQAEKFALRAIQRAAGSSPRALRSALERRHWDDLATRAAKVPFVQKTAVLFELIERHRARDEKVIGFTGFRPTLDMLVEAARARMPVAVYHGGLDRKQKVETIRSFEAEAPLLLTTEAAGEGCNLQYCHVMINYDLPWNPMQIEQRLGRIHRIGQQHDVALTNLVGVGTLEEHILRVLESKINLFELVVGELDMILGRIDDDFDFERFVFDSHVASRLVPAELPRAVGAAHAAIDERAARRASALERQAHLGLRDEQQRAESYYGEVLAALEQRRAAAPPERRPLLEARAEATELERRRRLREIAAKFESSRSIAPYRLNLLFAPALAFAVDVRRGERRYPFTLHWLVAAGCFAQPCCPHCDALETLIAGRSQLGCRRCATSAQG